MQANAVVLAVRNRKAVILASGGIYEEIPNQGYSVGERIEWTCKKNALPATRLRKGLMIAACLTLLLTSSVIAGTKYLPWTYVSVALGETTVQYCLNARNEVISAQADTEEGQTILEQVAVSPYESIEDTMTRTLKTMRQDQAEEAPVHVEIASRFGDGKRAEDAVAEAGKAAEMDLALEQVPWQDRGRPMDHPPEANPEKRPQPTDQQEQPMQEKHEELPPAGAADIPGADRMEQTPPDGEAKTDSQEFLPENAQVSPPDDPMTRIEIPQKQPDSPSLPDSIQEPQNDGAASALPQETPPDVPDEPPAANGIPESSASDTSPSNDFLPPQRNDTQPDAFSPPEQQANTAPAQPFPEGNGQADPPPQIMPDGQKMEPPFHP